jgi:hypothetical protein
VAGTRHRAEWLKEVGNDVESVIYQQDHPRKPNYYIRHGNEVGAYLTFLVDFYDCLPNVSSRLTPSYILPPGTLATPD